MDSAKNRLAAKLIKAEIRGNLEDVSKFKAQLEDLISSPDASKLNANSAQSPVAQPFARPPGLHAHQPTPRPAKELAKPLDNRVKKFLSSTSSLGQMFAPTGSTGSVVGQMFAQERGLSASDEARMFAKTAAKFARDSMDTNNFSEEIDDSQLVLNRGKKHKSETSCAGRPPEAEDPSNEQKNCDRCSERQAKHLVIDKTFEFIYLALADVKPFLSSMSNVIIRNNDHSCDSFVSSSDSHQADAEKVVDSLRAAWKPRGYRCIIMETYFKNRRPSNREFVSCGKHFQVHCLPIKEKYFERARMCFKQALQESEKEWSMNKKLIQTTDDRRIQRCLPKGLSYFWVCFDNLKTGFGHIIEREQDFSRFFGVEILCGLLDKNFNPNLMNEREGFNEQFKRSRDFKLLYSKVKH